MKLREYRIENNLTQNEMANLLQTTQSTYSRYERNACEPDIETLKKISQILKVPIDALVENEVHNMLNINLLSDEEQYIVHTMQQLNKKFILRLEAYAHACIETQNEEDAIADKLKRNLL